MQDKNLVALQKRGTLTPAPQTFPAVYVMPIEVIISPLLNTPHWDGEEISSASLPSLLL